ncbi:hypothetical protein BC351_01130 [Paenibacillus ferrarius]|uniref:Uncharacterized protein n=1 Tax=Paenibacillus ferrarius TaxID=1469647 RepID=A0A1V4HSF3_9BACL|nr:hypothetical protein [Paenibacillus ferrarius]OPH61874.1 hypothetical protein BC351_01130 [Paenibacillus ferrarius]
MLTEEQLQEIPDILSTVFDGYTIEQSSVKLLQQLLNEHQAAKEGFVQQVSLASEVLGKNELLRKQNQKLIEALQECADQCFRQISGHEYNVVRIASNAIKEIQREVE